MKKNNFSLLLIFFISIYAGASMTKKLPEHPGYIVTVEEPGGAESKKPIKGIPLNHQYVFLKNGKEVTSQEDADTIIPIVKVKVLRSADRKKIIEIQEIGPDGTSLRRTYGAR
jgi:hypothetical protein